MRDIYTPTIAEIKRVNSTMSIIEKRRKEVKMKEKAGIIEPRRKVIKKLRSETNLLIKGKRIDGMFATEGKKKSKVILEGETPEEARKRQMREYSANRYRLFNTKEANKIMKLRRMAKEFKERNNE